MKMDRENNCFTDFLLPIETYVAPHGALNIVFLNFGIDIFESIFVVDEIFRNWIYFWN